MTTDRNAAVRAALERLTQEQGVLGATLITRDGLLVHNAHDKILSPETFSAMTAALMGAAETAFQELGGARQLRVTAETDSKKMVAIGANDELVLVVVGNGTEAIQGLVQQAEAAAKQLGEILAGG